MNTPMLPGLDLVAVAKEATDYEDLAKDNSYTAARLLMSHPDRYSIACRLYFEFKVSKRGVCEICKIGINTLNEIIRREEKSRGGDFLANQAKSRKSALKLRILDAIEESIDNGALGDFDIKEQIGILEKVENLTKDEQNTAKSSKPNGNTSDEPIDADYTIIANRLKS